MATTRTGPRDTTRVLNLVAAAATELSDRDRWTIEQGGALAAIERAHDFLKAAAEILHLIDARETKRQGRKRKPAKRPAKRKAAP
jgi:hypothetical protein